MKKQTYLYLPFTGGEEEKMDSKSHVEAWQENERVKINRMKGDFVQQVVEKNPLLEGYGETFRDLLASPPQDRADFFKKREDAAAAGQPLGVWNGDRLQAMKDALGQWDNLSQLDQPQIIQHTGSGKPLDFLKDKDPSTYSLYIVGGHSNTGVDRLASINTIGSSSRKELNGEQVVQRMEADGLPKNIESVKCFSCLSGTMVESDPAFAKGVAVALAKNGFEHVTTRGYGAPLWGGGYFERSTNSEAEKMADFHKHTARVVDNIHIFPQATRASEVAIDYRATVHADKNAGRRETIFNALENNEAFKALMPSEQARNGFYDYAAQKAGEANLPKDMNVGMDGGKVWMYTDARNVAVSAATYKDVRQKVAESLGTHADFTALNFNQRQGIYNHAAQVAMENQLEGLSGAKFQGDQITLSSKAGAQTFSVAEATQPKSDSVIEITATPAKKMQM